MLLTLLTSPHRALAAANARPNVVAGTAAVVATGIVSLVLGVLTSAVGGGGAVGIALSIALPFMLAVFWVASAFLVGTGGRLMGRPPRRRAVLALSGITFPVLALYAVIGLAQAGLDRLGAAGAATALGWLAFPVVLWFVALNAVVAGVVYELPALNATAVALIPYAVLSALVLALVVVLSALHAAGLV